MSVNRWERDDDGSVGCCLEVNNQTHTHERRKQPPKLLSTKKDQKVT